MRRSIKIVAAVGGACCIALAIARWGGSAETVSHPAAPTELLSVALGDAPRRAGQTGQMTVATGRASATLSSQDDASCEAGALRLIEHPQTELAMVRRVFRETPSARARAVAAVGLGRRKDLESLDDLVSALADESLVVRTRAIWAIRRILHNPYLHFQPHAGPSIRANEIKALQRECAFAKKAYAIKQWYRKRGLFPGTRGPDGRPLCPLARPGANNAPPVTSAPKGGKRP